MHPLTHRLQIVSLNSKTSFFLRQCGTSPLSKRFFFFWIWFIFPAAPVARVFQPFPLFSVIPSVSSRKENERKQRGRAKKETLSDSEHMLWVGTLMAWNPIWAGSWPDREKTHRESEFTWQLLGMGWIFIYFSQKVAFDKVNCQH